MFLRSSPLPFASLVPLAALVLLASCQENQDNPEKWDCVDNSECGEMQICTEEAHECIDVECLASSDCDLQHYCDVGDTYTCVQGCETDDDCAAGEECTDAQTCEAYGCRSTTLDCEVGTVCNESTGECEVYDESLCQETCDVYGRGSSCSPGTSCQAVSITDTCMGPSDCDQDAGYACDQFYTSSDYCYSNQDCPDGSTCDMSLYVMGFCVANYCHKDFCMPTCSTGGPQGGEDSCPAGFTCTEGSMESYCYGDCGYYAENGYL